MKIQVNLSNRDLGGVFKKLSEFDGFNPSDDKPKFTPVEISDDNDIVTIVKIEATFAMDENDKILWHTTMDVLIDSYIDGCLVDTDYNKRFFDIGVAILNERLHSLIQEYRDGLSDRLIQ